MRLWLWLIEWIWQLELEENWDQDPRCRESPYQQQKRGGREREVSSIAMCTPLCFCVGSV